MQLSNTEKYTDKTERKFNMSEKTNGQLLAEKLTYKSENSFDKLKDCELEAASEYALGYKKFLDSAKTEREAVKTAVKMAEENGFKPYTFGCKLKAGDKYYYNNRFKSFYAFKIGSEPVENGIRIAAAHIDSPRLDLKPRPLYEDSELAFLKTHYYGGIKKYQWTANPLALHGTVVLKDNTVLDVVIGEDENDPVLYINDLPPHLAQNQNQKTLALGIEGEALNLLVGSKPYPDKEISDKVKLNVLSILNEKYGITEADLISAELSAVPCAKARDAGLDRSMIASYGHDDRVCAYPELTAIFSSDCLDTHTVMAVLADKEETGSQGNTGMQSALIADLIEDIATTLGSNGRVCRANSKCLSADVNVAYDPNFPEVFEKRNTAFLNHGVVLSKYTGSRGKSGTSDASAEFLGYIKNNFDRDGVIWQIAELGKVDQGGGGTVAAYIADLNIDVIDLGVPVISMHAPIEVVAKTDVYMAHKAVLSLFNS